MKGLIIRNAYFKSAEVDYQVDRIKYELENLGVLVDVVKNGYDVYVDSNSEIVSLYKDYDFCVFLDKDKYLGEMLEKLGLKVFNNHQSISSCDDKMLTLLKLANSGIKVPKTISAPLCFSSGATLSLKDADKIIDILSLPLVVKKSFSSLGKGVYLVNSKQELIDIVNENAFEPKIYQEFISSSFGKDVRIICVNKKYLCSMLRSSKGDFRSNAALGGDAVEFKPDNRYVELAEKVANILNLDYMGIDLMIGEAGEPVLCEVNSNAFFTTMERVCNVNVAKAYAEHIVNTVKELK